MEENEAWKLFRMKAFPRNASTCSCPTELEELAKDVVGKCQGLPLAVVSLGGLFSTKHSGMEWKTIYNGLNWELSNNSTLKPIKNYEIERERLARFWMAEGFIENVSGMRLEEVADRYLGDLISQCLLQVVGVDGYGQPRKCKMHDMLRELALLKSKEEKFCGIYGGEGIGTRPEEGLTRRLSIQASRAEIKPWKGTTPREQNY
ncbi:hypothetical protein Tsubulata_027307 [Turnera subulata]|uniref:Disease resistance protein winged helix domain-containing protein n=1 Tax=Turnera subulata TaxID=218843 RepID=A0A9Q0JLN9_9ROSI|nr:hypothetical protein Tsubulata_027307 [Turnera subulata]